MRQQLVSTPIKSMGKVITGRTPSTKNQEYYGNDYFFISPADLGNRKYVSDSIKKLSDFGIKKANKLPPQTILFTCIGSTIGKIGMSENECATNQQINAVIVDKNNFDPNYVYYQLARHSLRIAELAGRQAVPIVNKSTFESYEINTHPFEEQKKIAQILSTWDEAIEAVGELIEKKNQLKKTLLNTLVIGNKKADNFSDNKWITTTIDKLGQIYAGGTPSTNVSEYWNGAVAWCTPTDITALKGQREISKTKRTITEKGLKKSSANLLPKNSIIVCTRATIGDTAMNTVPMATNQGFKSIVPNDSIDNTYLYYLILTFKKYFIRYSSGSTFLELSKKDFSKTKITIPKSIDEQKQIANVMINLDEEIDLLVQKKSLLKKQKKGLMQRLLTGKVRVN